LYEINFIFEQPSERADIMREQTILLSSSPAEPELLLKGLHPPNRVYKLVLTGGPCGGKTTAQSKLATFFESLGWKVFRVPETATVLMSGGVAFGELNEEQVFDFQARTRSRRILSTVGATNLLLLLLLLLLFRLLLLLFPVFHVSVLSNSTFLTMPNSSRLMTIFLVLSPTLYLASFTSLLGLVASGPRRIQFLFQNKLI
jgi:hypothetical protein